MQTQDSPLRHVLQLDLQGTPQAWISVEQAAVHVATGSVAWVDGDGPLRSLRGGWNVATGRQSVIDVHPIVALRGASRINLFGIVPAITKARLLRRDRYTCAYCAGSSPSVSCSVNTSCPRAGAARRAG